MRTIHRDVVGAFIFSSDNKLLLGKSRKGGVYPNTWIVPGGGIEEGETQLEALAREMMEETGLDINFAQVEKIPGGFSGQSKKTLKENNEIVMVDMTFSNYSIKLSTEASKTEVVTEDDFVDPRWVDLSELNNLELSPPSITTLKGMGYL